VAPLFDHFIELIDATLSQQRRSVN
jgi:hypothetical protein